MQKIQDTVCFFRGALEEEEEEEGVFTQLHLTSPDGDANICPGPLLFATLVAIKSLTSLRYNIIKSISCRQVK